LNRFSASAAPVAAARAWPGACATRTGWPARAFATSAPSRSWSGRASGRACWATLARSPSPGVRWHRERRIRFSRGPGFSGPWMMSRCGRLLSVCPLGLPAPGRFRGHAQGGGGVCRQAWRRHGRGIPGGADHGTHPGCLRLDRHSLGLQEGRLRGGRAPFPDATHHAVQYQTAGCRRIFTFMENLQNNLTAMPSVYSPLLLIL